MKNFINLKNENNIYVKKFTEINKNDFSNNVLNMNKYNFELKSNRHKTLSHSLLDVSNKLILNNLENENYKLKKFKYYNFSINFIKAMKMIFLPFLKSSKEFIKEHKFVKKNINKLIDYKIINKKLVLLDIIKNKVLKNENNLISDKKYLFLTKSLINVT